MKRIVAFFVIALVGFGVVFGTKGDEFDFQGLEKVCFVTDLTHAEDENAVINGNDVYITVSAGKVKEIKLDKVKGYVLYFDKNCDESMLVNRFLDYSSDFYYVGSTRIVNGYNAKYHDYRFVEGKKYNVQIAFTDESILVGFPMILTGF